MVRELVNPVTYKEQLGVDPEYILNRTWEYIQVPVHGSSYTSVNTTSIQFAAQPKKDEGLVLE